MHILIKAVSQSHLLFLYQCRRKAVKRLNGLISLEKARNGAAFSYICDYHYGLSLIDVIRVEIEWLTRNLTIHCQRFPIRHSRINQSRGCSLSTSWVPLETVQRASRGTNGEPSPLHLPHLAAMLSETPHLPVFGATLSGAVQNSLSAKAITVSG